MRKALAKIGATLPLLAYLCIAIWRALWVPCVWTFSYGVKAFPGITRSATMPLWRITTESPRYGLVAFEEGVLLALLLFIYGAVYLLFPQTRRRILGR